MFISGLAQRLWRKLSAVTLAADSRFVNQPDLRAGRSRGKRKRSLHIAIRTRKSAVSPTVIRYQEMDETEARAVRCTSAWTRPPISSRSTEPNGLLQFLFPAGRVAIHIAVVLRLGLVLVFAPYVSAAETPGWVPQVSSMGILRWAQV